MSPGRRGRIGDEMERTGTEQRYGAQLTLTYCGSWRSIHTGQ